MTDEEIMKATGPISHAEAKEIYRRFYNSATNRKDGIRISPNADSRWDDHMRLYSYISQCEQMAKLMHDDLCELISLESECRTDSAERRVTEYQGRLKELKALPGGDK